MTKKCPVCQAECEDAADFCLNEICGWQFIQLLSDSQTERNAYEVKLVSAKSNYLDKMIKQSDVAAKNTTTSPDQDTMIIHADEAVFDKKNMDISEKERQSKSATKNIYVSIVILTLVLLGILIYDKNQTILKKINEDRMAIEKIQDVVIKRQSELAKKEADIASERAIEAEKSFLLAKEKPETGSLTKRQDQELIDDRYADNGDGTVTDVKTHLQWMRCGLGQTWDRNKCIGKTKLYTWHQAMRFSNKFKMYGKTDWRLPSKEELNSLLIYCRSGMSFQLNPTQNTCINEFYPQISELAFPTEFRNAEFVWSSTSSDNDDTSGSAVGVSLIHGKFYPNSKNLDENLLLVRNSQ